MVSWSASRQLGFLTKLCLFEYLFFIVCLVLKSPNGEWPIGLFTVPGAILDLRDYGETCQRSVDFIKIFPQWMTVSLGRILFLLLRKEEKDTCDAKGNPTGLHFFPAAKQMVQSHGYSLMATFESTAVFL